jgi:hypothetical protein
VESPADEEGEVGETTLGQKYGQGEELLFSDYSELAAWAVARADEQGDDALKVKINRDDDTHRYAEALAEGPAEGSEG